MTNVHKFESNGRFGLSWMPDRQMFNDDLGRGGAQTEAFFMTGEGRTYFIHAEELRERTSATIGRLEAELRFLKTVKGANRNLREVRERNRM